MIEEFAGAGRVPLTERHVQAIWMDPRLRPRHLVTRRGTELHVVHPGDWNAGPGPDFRNALLELGRGRTRIRGDVEIHLDPRDWEAHGHGNDPAYRNVIAHVTWRGGPDPQSLPAGAVSVWIGRFLTADIGFTPEAIDLTAYPFVASSADAGRPCHLRYGGDPEAAGELLIRAGRERLQAKARAFRESVQRDAVQRYYAAVMRALGYSRNAAGFEAVAAAVPYAAVAAEPDHAAAAFRTAATFVDWDRRGVRPWNSPEVRLEAAAEIFTKTDVMALAAADDFSARKCRGMVKALTAGRLLGRGRAAAVLANVIVPFALAEGRLGEAPAWLPPEDVSEPVRRMACRLFGIDHNPLAHYAGNGLAIQGLLQVFRAICSGVHPECERCRLTT